MAPRPNLSHFGIFVRDLAKMERFYTRVFGLGVTDRGSGQLIKYQFVFLSADPRQHHQLVLASGRPETATFSTIMQMSFKHESLAELRLTLERARDAGVTDMNGLDHGNAWSVYFPDPEGNMLEAYVDAPFYIPQPFANPLDLSLSDEEILAKTEAACRACEGFQPVEDWRAAFGKTLESQTEK